MLKYLEIPKSGDKLEENKIMKKVSLILAVFFLLSVSVKAQKVVAEKAITVQAGGYTWFDYNFSEPATLKGRFKATGGKNDIEVYILDDDGLENFKNGNQAQTFYNSGRVTVANFNVRLPKGSFHLVFNNRWSLITPKAVTIWFYE
jgi:hypothetical protein